MTLFRKEFEVSDDGRWVRGTVAQVHGPAWQVSGRPVLEVRESDSALTCLQWQWGDADGSLHRLFKGERAGLERILPEPAIVDRLDTPVVGSLRMSVGNGVAERAEVVLLGPEWVAWGPGASVHLATHVQPIAEGAIPGVSREFGGSREHGRSHESGLDSPWEILRHIFDRVKDELLRLGTSASTPETRVVSGFTVQRSVSAGDLLAPRAGTLHANCLDLSLLLAGVGEGLGLQPVLLLFGPDGGPDHVACAFWNDGGRRYQPVLRGDAIRAAVESGSLVPLEATALLDPTASIAGACERGRQWVDRRLDLHGVEIQAQRPPHGDRPPLVPAYSPTVVRVLAALEKQSPPWETLQLLSALLSVSSPTVMLVAKEAGGDVAKLQSVIDHALRDVPKPSKGSVASSSHGMTRSLGGTLRNAQRIAVHRGSRTVGETDLVWAILESSSRNIHRVLMAAGIESSRLALALHSIAPRESVESALRSPGLEPDG